MAVQHYKEGLKMDPEHKECKVGHKQTKNLLKKVNRGDSAMAEGKFSEAIEYWNDAIKMDDEHHVFIAPTLINIANAYSKANNHDEAVNTCNLAINIEETSEALFCLSDVYTNAEKYQEAIRPLQRASELKPDDQSIRQKIQKAEAALKQSKSKNYYKILGISRNADQKEVSERSGR